MNKCLNNGMVGGVHMGAQREGTLSVTVERRVAIRGNNPILRMKSGKQKHFSMIFLDIRSPHNFSRMHAHKLSI